MVISAWVRLTLPHALLSLGRSIGSQACPAASSSSSSPAFRANEGYDIFFGLYLAVGLLVGNEPAIKTAKKKKKMSGRGKGRGRKRKNTKGKPKTPKSSKRPRACSIMVKPSTAPPAERPGDCLNGPHDVDSFPEMIRAIEGVYINTAQSLKRYMPLPVLIPVCSM